MLIHVARTGCFESESYTVTPANIQIMTNAHPPDSDLWSGGWDYSGSAPESALSAVAALLLNPRSAR